MRSLVPDCYVVTCSVEEAASLLKSCRWTWAKTYAKFAPHWWTHRSSWPSEVFTRVVEAIHAHGVDVPWGRAGKIFRYLRPGDGYQYWVMDKPEQAGETVILNRAEWKA